MRPRERGIPMRMRSVVWVCAIALVAAGCSRLTFIKPDLGRGEFDRTAPELDITTDDRSKGAGAARVVVQHGQIAFTQGKLDEARRLAEQALELDPRSAAAHTLRAVIADRSGDSRLAGRHYRQAVELAPYVGGMHNNYGTWLCANNREDESLQWFDQALADRNYPTPAVALANAGACADKAGERERAVRYLDAALQIDPANPVALGAMAELEFSAGRALQARAFSQRRLDAAPADAASLMLASQIEQKLGDREAADRYVQRLRAEFPAASGSGTGDDGKR